MKSLFFKKRNRKFLIKSILYASVTIFLIASIIYLLKLFVPNDLKLFNIRIYIILHVLFTSLVFVFIIINFYISLKSRQIHINYVKDKLSRSEDKFKNIYKNSPVMMFSLDNKNNIIDVNNHFLNISGYLKKEIINKHISRIILNSKNLQKILLKLKPQESLKDYEATLKCNNNNYLTIQFNVNKYSNENNEEIMLCVLKDITEQNLISRERENLIIRLEKAYEEAKEANRLKSEFLAIVTHELKTPITSMLGFSEILKNNENVNKDIQYIGEVLYKSSRKLLEILTEIIELSVIVAGNIKINQEVFNAMEIIDDIHSFIKNDIETRPVDFIIENFQYQKIYNDKHKLRQILYNLINNALKFTEKGEVILRNESTNKEYIFLVIDTGIGINESKQNIIFEMFRQAEDVFRRKYGGVGLGLTISKRLVEALGGNIRAEKNSKQGSTFIICLPRDIKMEKLPINNIDKKIANARKNILIADDDEQSIKSIIASELNKSFNFVNFDDGEKLLYNYKNNRKCDLILLDIQMKKMDGIECLFEIRKLNKKIPVIAMSSYNSKNSNNIKDKYLLMGFTDYIKKPINIYKLQEKIEYYI